MKILACRHLTRLDLLSARGSCDLTVGFDIGFQALIERGESHERAVLERFRADGFHVVEIGEDRQVDARTWRSTV